MFKQGVVSFKDFSAYFSKKHILHRRVKISYYSLAIFSDIKQFDNEFNLHRKASEIVT